MVEGVEGEDERIEDLELYRLDYERGEEDESGPCMSITVGDTKAVAVGGETLRPGDHIYVWCGVYQHHGIVLQIKDAYSILIAEFTNAALADPTNNLLLSVSDASRAIGSDGVTGGFRLVWEHEPQNAWHKVKYRAHPVECLTWRPGTCSGATPDALEQILTRVKFLQECRHLIPNYHILASNCETVAVWCTTGKWETLQGGRAMNVSQVAGGTLAVMAGMPVGLAASGLALWHSMHISQRWKETTELLNKQFEWYSMGKSTRSLVMSSVSCWDGAPPFVKPPELEAGMDTQHEQSCDDS